MISPAMGLVLAGLLFAEDRPPSIPAANELGEIMILEYHRIEPAESRWARSAGNFRKDLRRLYTEGFRPISLGEFLDGDIPISAGLKPILLTFDDSSPGQFRLSSPNTKAEIDPESAVGMLIHFQKEHPDFRLRGVFFVLPEADQPNRLFGQPGLEAEKLRQLTALGFEIGNHTLWHADLKKCDRQQVQKQLALAVDFLQGVLPGYPVRGLSLPFGNYPLERSLVLQGAYKGIGYRHEAVMKVSGGPSFSPFHLRCDLSGLPRIQMTGSELEHWLRYFEQHPAEVFISDGHPKKVTFPASSSSFFNSRRYPYHSLRAE
jgi:peptidoglycan/xylan/chitin deacetylase (PgdA/CDA1 family)